MTNQPLLDKVFYKISDYFSKKLCKNVQLKRIQPETIQVWTQTWSENPRTKPDGNFDWAKLRDVYYHKKFPYNNPRMIDIAIWEERQLCGLSIGGIPKEKNYISIDYIEGCPIEHSLKGHILDILLTVIEQYARILEISELRLNDPVEALIERYESQYGFQTVKTVSPSKSTQCYCFKNI